MKVIFVLTNEWVRQQEEECFYLTWSSWGPETDLNVQNVVCAHSKLTVIAYTASSMPYQWPSLLGTVYNHTGALNGHLWDVY